MSFKRMRHERDEEGEWGGRDREEWVAPWHRVERGELGISLSPDGWLIEADKLRFQSVACRERRGGITLGLREKKPSFRLSRRRGGEGGKLTPESRLKGKGEKKKKKKSSAS